MAKADTQKPQDKWFCIGQSGPTVDGREIKAEWLEQASTNYNPEGLKGARLNVDHMRGWYWGVDNEYNGYGDVLELKHEKDGAITKLFARIDPTDKLLELNEKRIKVFTSMELVINFAQTGKAYLTGLALTDDPASLGVSMLQFNTQNTNPDIIHSGPIEMTDKTKSPAVPGTESNEPNAGILAAAKAIVAQVFAIQPKPAEVPAPVPAPESFSEAVEVIKDMATGMAEFKKMADERDAEYRRLKTSFDNLEAEFSALKNTPDAAERQAHAGGESYTSAGY